MVFEKKYMSRCLELANCGLGGVAPNPMVGCVIVYKDTIIGEGYHNLFGGPHAEVNAIESVSDKELLKKSTLYVNLEPCAHWGKTPPCSDLIIETGIPEVVIGCLDIFAEVNGKGIERLRTAGVKVETGLMEAESLDLNKRFFTFHKHKRPYIILKWAQTGDGFIAREDYSSKWITNPYSRLLVHQWRSEEAAIMVGTNTAIYDNPQLSSRDMKARNPVRIVFDKEGRIPETHHLFDGNQKTLVFTILKKAGKPNLEFVQVDFRSPDLLKEVMHFLYENDIQSVIIEGGSALLKSFIKADLWDEARVFENREVFFGKGIAAPLLDRKAEAGCEISGDSLSYYFH
jgi:diaminohydroxyphosphoribosylaminopyrimidine deaminase/5-amino-6-(5-phosphoribosylamino)uracil reductase